MPDVPPAGVSRWAGLAVAVLFACVLLVTCRGRAVAQEPEPLPAGPWRLEIRCFPAPAIDLMVQAGAMQRRDLFLDHAGRPWMTLRLADGAVLLGYVAGDLFCRATFAPPGASSS